MELWGLGASESVRDKSSGGGGGNDRLVTDNIS